MQGLYALKPWYTRRLGRAVAAAERRGLSPDVFTLAGVLAAAAAGGALALGWWWAALPLLALRLAGANLDGAVARARGVSRPWGFVLNELGDRAGDLLMWAGLAWWAAQHSTAALVAVLVATVAATLPTFASLSAAGAGATRVNGGPLGKTERCALAVLGCAVPSWLVGISVVVVVGSLATAALRLRTARGELRP
ncbi:CDP-alcohol phosphatidyltransferase family protein [Ornithinimicrobium cerasi]|uniref:CDP-diacylglycerol--glycerol-3-phosphate 3-phosphatidyltransferase n=1 Tax=Ornithinimicrobium cerasi TaxID=2248773 RepID=A0A285VBA2_9MICO|nr:CDP-alcohol phosphatidyltransferase family protein [Ornithinimicrobium cerasi]SOC51283.1 CDP-diacylglycerol--glycerol-3-phosphate 3-phosphatidyltransferase [Ornithinimicrobium cerasi]